MDEVGVMVKKEQDRSDTLDREYRALWTQLTKRQMTNADDYTTELFEKQIKSQNEENYARFSCLATAQNSIKNVLKKTSAMYETANYGVHVLSETVNHTQGEITAFYDRVKTTKHKREDALASVLRKVTLQKSILDGLGESVLVTKQHLAAMDKLSALLSKLKIAEDVSFTSLKENFEGTTLHIKNRASTGDDVRCSIGDFELRTKEMRHVLQKEVALSRYQENTGTSNKVIDEQNNLKKSSDYWSSSEMQLSALTDECKSVSEKLANLCDELSSAEVELTSRTSDCQREFRTKKKDMSDKLFELERQGAHGQEQSSCLNGQLESFRGRYGNTVDIKNWDGIREEKNIREKDELLASLTSEITTFSNDVATFEMNTVDLNKEKMHDEFISVLQGDLIAYMEIKEREEASVCEKNLDSQYKLSAPVDLVENERSVTRAGYRTSDSSVKQLSAIERERSANEPSNKEEDSLFSSFSDFTDSEKSSASEKFIAKRFPNDIFLKPSPSVDRNESVSAEVSTFDRSDDDQSIWSPAQSCKQRKKNCITDMTTEADLDQSVW
ncbi:unnamed protein product [Angiostrongylus costaricensis]|uniref:Microtub_bind domain-containing protein n=1 Tax=Angiostrongylus costaricensis TaxID=334426 RepID=A0A158PIB5_ANGCS|nr:unnamed protein product [Angiostrongylus costaricensis]